MKTLLDDLNHSLPGIVGSMLCDNGGRILARAFPSAQGDAGLRDAAAALADCAESLPKATGTIGLIDVRYPNSRLVVKPVGNHSLLLLCEKTVNFEALLVSASVAGKRLEQFTSQAETKTPVTAGLAEDVSAPASVEIDERSPEPLPIEPERPRVVSAKAKVTKVTVERDFDDEREEPERISPKHWSPIALVLGAAALLLIGGLAYRFIGGRTGGTTTPASGKEEPKASSDGAPAMGEPVLRITGADTLGTQLVLALAETYLAFDDPLRRGKSEPRQLVPALADAYIPRAEDVKVSNPKPDEYVVQAKKEGAFRGITVTAHGTGAGLDDLVAGTADIAIASRRISPEERKKLISLGSMTSQANEHVLALGGLAVIVNMANPITNLKREQLKGIFSGTISDWTMVGVAGDEATEWATVGVGGGKGGTIASGIHSFAPGEKSGVSDVFQGVVLGGKPFSSDVGRLPDFEAVRQAVITNPGGIAFLPFPLVRGVKPVAVSDLDDPPMIPTAFTVATEEYFLTHRIYLYTAQASKNPNVSKFVEFALGPVGQAVVNKSGFVELVIKAEPRIARAGSPGAYRKLVEGARRLSSTFRFEINSSAFDNRAVRDLDRVVDYLRDDLNGAQVRLFGFADSQGAVQANIKLSRDRANQVAQALAQRGISGTTIIGFGSALPVADNSTEEGRARNRRVEVWLSR